MTDHPTDPERPLGPPAVPASQIRLPGREAPTRANGPPDDGLLAALRHRTGQQNLAFDDPPVRLTGGFETDVYAFALRGGPGQLVGPQVLRLFDRSSMPRRASFEAALHEGLRDQGFPVPEIRWVDDAPYGLERPFVVMEKLPGKVLTETLDPTILEAATRGEFGPAIRAVPGIARILTRTLPISLARMERRLARVDPAAVLDALGRRGFDAESIRFERHLDALEQCCDETGLHAFDRVLDWLRTSRPAPRDREMIAHGDMPGNILFDGDHVAGVIDWSSEAVTLADPAFEVGNTLTLLSLKVPLRSLLRAPVEFVQRTALHRYLQEVQQTLRLSAEAVDYYQAFRCVKILVREALCRLDRAGLSDAQVRPLPWSDPAVTDDLADRVHRLTGIYVALPDSTSTPRAHGRSR